MPQKVTTTKKNGNSSDKYMYIKLWNNTTDKQYYFGIISNIIITLFYSFHSDKQLLQSFDIILEKYTYRTIHSLGHT